MKKYQLNQTTKSQVQLIGEQRVPSLELRTKEDADHAGPSQQQDPLKVLLSLKQEI
jgi:hypothetical protein